MHHSWIRTNTYKESKAASVGARRCRASAPGGPGPWPGTRFASLAIRQVEVNGAFSTDGARRVWAAAASRTAAQPRIEPRIAYVERLMKGCM